MAKRKGRKAARTPNFSATGKRPFMAAPKESQVGPTRPSTPPLPESSPKSKFAAALNLEILASVAASSNKVASDNSVEDVSSDRTEDLKNAAESEKPNAKDEKTESFQKCASVPDDSKEAEEKPKENPDSPLALTCITRILKGVAHCPHFRHLRQYNRVVREQLESAWDRAFIETANRIQRLKLKDFWVNGIELWQATTELQTMGYDLISLRRRLLEVRDMVLEFEQSEREVSALTRKAAKFGQRGLRLQRIMQKLLKMHEEAGIKMAIAVKKAEEIQKELPKCDVLISQIAKGPFGP